MAMHRQGIAPGGMHRVTKTLRTWDPYPVLQGVPSPRALRCGCPVILVEQPDRIQTHHTQVSRCKWCYISETGGASALLAVRPVKTVLQLTEISSRRHKIRPGASLRAMTFMRNANYMTVR